MASGLSLPGTGLTITQTGGSTSLVVGTTTITGGTTSGILWNNAGVLAAGPALSDATGNLSLPSAATLSWNSDTILSRVAANVLGLANSTNAQGFQIFNTTSGTAAEWVSLDWTTASNIFTLNTAASGTGTVRGMHIAVGGTTAINIGTSRNVILSPAANTTALTLTGNATGGSSTVIPGLSITGTLNTSGNVGGAAIFANITNTASNAASRLIDLQVGSASVLAATMLGSVVLNSAAIATTATDGFLYITTSAGTPTGTPTGFTGRVPIIFDTTNSQFWVFTGGAWKQPKTPAAAAIVTWQ